MKRFLPLLLIALLWFCSCKEKNGSLPYFQDFENPEFPPKGMETFPVGTTDYNWERSTAASGFGKGSACLNYPAFTVPSSLIDSIYRGIRLPVMDFTGVTDPYVRFDIAAADRIVDSVNVSDTFGWWWNKDPESGWNNSGWTLVKNYIGPSLSTAPATAQAFVPTANQWKTVTLPITVVANMPVLRLAVEDDFAGGNNIYVDNILVFDSATATR